MYYAYLAAVKEQDGAAMSMGRIDAFLDTYFEKDLKSGRITEPEVQELVDQFVMKMRIVRWVWCCLCRSLLTCLRYSQVCCAAVIHLCLL